MKALILATAMTMTVADAFAAATDEQPTPAVELVDSTGQPRSPAGFDDKALVAPDPWVTSPATAELATRAAAIVDAYADHSASLTQDGKQAVFVSSRSGLPQLFVADLADRGTRAPKRLVEWGEPMGSPLVTWDGQSVIFTSDTGGDELRRFFRVALAGGAVETLTPKALQRDPPFLPEGAPTQLIYTARLPGAAVSSIYSASLTAGGEVDREIYRDTGSGFLLEVSKDGRFGLFARYNSHQDTLLLIVDLKTGAARTLYPRAGQATIRSAALAVDGKRVYVGTDGGGEAALVIALDFTSGDELARYVEASPPTATPKGMLITRTGSVLALSFAAGDRTEVRLLDAETLKPRTPASLPLGSGELSSFSDDGRTLIVDWSTPGHPSALLAIDTINGKVAPLIDDNLSASGPALTVESASVASFDGLAIPVNVYRPTKEGRLPVIVRLHGGPAGVSVFGWSAQARFFNSEGYAWVEPNIRGSSGFGRAFEAADNGARRVDSFRDVDAVRRWVTEQPWADRDRLVVLGESFGGYLVLHELTANPSAWRAGVNQFGIADFLTFMASTTGLVRQNYLNELGDPEKQRDLLVNLSPLRSVDRIAAPLFVYAGENDPRVPRQQSDAIVAALRGRQVPVEYMVGKNEGHGAYERANRIEMMVRTARFLDAALAPPGMASTTDE